MTGARETFEGFRALGPDEILHRAKDAEEQPLGPNSGAVDTRSWRQLYRDMRKAGARTVSDLKPWVVEQYAAKLGYGYFRVGYGRTNPFLPFEAAR